MGSKIRDIPVVAVGPGSQPAEDDGAVLEYIDLPHDISSYERPMLPEPDAVEHLAGAREAMDWLRAALARYVPGEAPLIADLGALDEANRELVNQVLGDGEVSVDYTGAVRAKMQESVLAGVWRSFYLGADGGVRRDILEVADVPLLVRTPWRSRTAASGPLTAVAAPPEAGNAAAILAELEEERRSRRPGEPAHVVNLTLLPMAPADVGFLETALGQGPIRLLSRGYGTCQVTSTAVESIWWVRYYNSMRKLILDTIEVVEVPEVTRAAAEDIRDSARRLDDILEPYWRAPA